MAGGNQINGASETSAAALRLAGISGISAAHQRVNSGESSGGGMAARKTRRKQHRISGESAETCSAKAKESEKRRKAKSGMRHGAAAESGSNLAAISYQASASKA
jgi:hypothetical protein